MKRLAALVCVALVGGFGGGGHSRCHGVAGIMRVCVAAAQPPRVTGGVVGPVYRTTIQGMKFRCRPHVYPGGFVIRCVLAKSPDAA